MSRPLLSSGLLLALAACREPLDDNLSEVVAPRILAIQSVPAEAEPGAPVTYRALFVDGRGERTEGELDWAFCLAARPLTELGAVNGRCLAPADAALSPLGVGLEVAGDLPEAGCRLFGPDPPVPEPGVPAGRPVDPDVTGGYHQPVRLRVGGEADAEYVVGATRLSCGLAGATPEVAADFARRSRPNENPALASLHALSDGGEVWLPPAPAPDEEPVLTVRAGDPLDLRVAWSTCPTAAACGDGICSRGEDEEGCPGDCTEPKGCTGAETYLFLDPERRELEVRHEAMRVAWATTLGSFEADHTGRDEGEVASGAATSDNTFVAPDLAGDAEIFVVLRDDRGGVGWGRYRVRVSPR